MRRDPQTARRFNDRITLTKTVATVDSMSHASIGAPVAVLEVYAQVRQMSATKTMLTFQQADVVGVDIEMRKPDVAFDGITWRGHEIHFPTPLSAHQRLVSGRQPLPGGTGSGSRARTRAGSGTR